MGSHPESSVGIAYQAQKVVEFGVLPVQEVPGPYWR